MLECEVSNDPQEVRHVLSHQHVFFLRVLWLLVDVDSLKEVDHEAYALESALIYSVERF